MQYVRYWLLLCIVTGGFSHATKADALLAIVIDDIGYNQALSERAARLKGAFTLAILPFTPHGFTSAQIAHSSGKELILHAPMSNIGNKPLGAGGLYSGMSKVDFMSVLRRDLNSLPYLSGVNNHMGSQLTQESEPMEWLMEEIRERGLYFLDSRTSAHTKAFEIALAHQIPSLKRDVFLDDIEDQSAIEQQLARAIHIARQNGSAIAIGHPYPATLSVLENNVGNLARQKITLVYASHLLKSITPNGQIEIFKGLQPVPTEPPYCPINNQNEWFKSTQMLIYMN